jgi:hypothetical protein
VRGEAGSGGAAGCPRRSPYPPRDSRHGVRTLAVFALGTTAKKGRRSRTSAASSSARLHSGRRARQQDGAQVVREDVREDGAVVVDVTGPTCARGSCRQYGPGRPQNRAATRPPRARARATNPPPPGPPPHPPPGDVQLAEPPDGGLLQLLCVVGVVVAGEHLPVQPDRRVGLAVADLVRPVGALLQRLGGRRGRHPGRRALRAMRSRVREAGARGGTAGR